MKTITFYSYKGGVGRSLILANIADRLSEFGKKVCLLDFDLEAPGLPFKFDQYFDINNIQKGIVDYLYDFSKKRKVNNSIRDFSIELEMGANKQNMILIPAGDHGAKDYWRKLASINWYEIIYENPSITLQFFLDLKQKIKKEFKPDYLLIDSRTGISEMSGITLSLLADEVVLVAANNKENLNGVKKIISGLNNPDNNINGVVPKISFVLSRVPFTDKQEDRIRELALINRVGREYLEPLVSEVSVIHSDRELEENEVIKIAYNKEEAVSQIAKDYLNLFERITKEDLSEIDIKKFNDIKLSEKLFKKAVAAESNQQKMEFISKAISLNSNNTNFYLYRALVYDSTKQYTDALNDCFKALSLDKNNEQATHLIVAMYIRLKEYSKAESVLLELLKANPNNIASIHDLGIVYSNNHNYNKAIDVYYKIIELDPFNAYAYNGIANVKRLKGDLNGALKHVYKALELNFNLGIAHATLSEIHAALGNIDEFYLHFENSLKFSLEDMKEVIEQESIYIQFYNEDRFRRVLEKYCISFLSAEEHIFADNALFPIEK